LLLETLGNGVQVLKFALQSLQENFN